MVRGAKSRVEDREDKSYHGPTEDKRRMYLTRDGRPVADGDPQAHTLYLTGHEDDATWRRKLKEVQP